MSRRVPPSGAPCASAARLSVMRDASRCFEEALVGSVEGRRWQGRQSRHEPEKQKSGLRYTKLLCQDSFTCFFLRMQSALESLQSWLIVDFLGRQSRHSRWST